MDSFRIAPFISSHFVFGFAVLLNVIISVMLCLILVWYFASSKIELFNLK